MRRKEVEQSLLRRIGFQAAGSNINVVSQEFSHLDEEGRPAMVNVGGKKATRRSATARALVALPPEVLAQFEGEEIQTRKGPVFQTAVLAGIMGAKKTSELIPLCHPLGLDRCDVHIRLEGAQVIIECTAGVDAKTGVEMEALTGATVAALTIYDMCKAFSHDIVIREVTLLEKTGGKHDFKR